MMAYMLGYMVRVRTILLASAAAALLGACATVVSAPPPGPARPGPGASFSASDFAWSLEKGRNTVSGRLGYRQGETPFTCAGATVILTPETAWSRRRMVFLYASAERAVLPADEVRARTPSAPPGDSSAFTRRATCDAADHYTFSGLPEGAWYLITVARPVGGVGTNMALMRRVVTRAGRVAPADL